MANTSKKNPNVPSDINRADDSKISWNIKNLSIIANLVKSKKSDLTKFKRLKLIMSKKSDLSKNQFCKGQF